MNTDEPLWKSDISYLAVIINLLVFGVFFILFQNNDDFPQDIFKGPYLPFDNWMVLCVLLLIIIAAICGIFKFLTAKYILYPDRLIIQTNYASEVCLPISTLQNWQYSQRGGGRSIYSEYIVLVFQEKTLRLDENSIDNVTELKNLLHDKFPGLETKPKLANTVINAFLNLFYIAAGFGFFALLGLWISMQSDNKGSAIKHFAVKLSEAPQFIEHTHKKKPSTYVMVLRSADIGNFNLTFSGVKDSDKTDYAISIHAGDSLPIDMLQYDYDVKVSKKKEPGFWDKHIGWYQIRVLEFWYFKNEAH